MTKHVPCCLCRGAINLRVFGIPNQKMIEELLETTKNRKLRADFGASFIKEYHIVFFYGFISESILSEQHLFV